VAPVGISEDIAFSGDGFQVPDASRVLALVSDLAEVMPFSDGVRWWRAAR